MNKFRLGVGFIAILAIALSSFSVFADTDVGFMPTVEKEQIFSGKITDNTMVKLKVSDNLAMADSDTLPDNDMCMACSGETIGGSGSNLSSKPDKPVAAYNDDNRLTRNSYHAPETRIRLQPG